MKKFLTALLSLCIAGTMAFSFAACKKDNNTDDTGGGTNNEQGGNTDGSGGGTNNDQTNNNEKENVSKALLDAISATTAAEKYKLSLNTDYDYTVLYNDAKVAADTVVFSTPDGDFTGFDLMKLIMDDEDLETFENPVAVKGPKYTYSFDFAGGKAKIEKDWGDEDADIEYYEVDGTTINNYYKSTYIHSEPDSDDVTTVVVLRQESYTGYVDAAQAKKVFKNYLLDDVRGMTLERVISQEVYGVGANSSKHGTIIELVDLFDYDDATKTYSATIAAPGEDGDLQESDFSLTIKDGKVSKMAMTSSMKESLDDEFPFPGVALEISAVLNVEYSDVGSLSVTVDEKYKDVEQENISVNHVFASETLWKELLTDFATTEFNLHYYNNRTGINYNYYVDLESNTAMSKQENWELGNRMYRYLREEGDEIAAYSGYATDGGFVDALNSSSEVPKGEDATATLIVALMDDFVADYYAGFDEGDLCDLFSKFEFTSLSQLSAKLKLNGKDVTVRVYFSYDSHEEKFSVNSIDVRYDEDRQFSVNDRAKGELESWATKIVDRGN